MPLSWRKAKIPIPAASCGEFKFKSAMHVAFFQFPFTLETVNYRYARSAEAIHISEFI